MIKFIGTVCFYFMMLAVKRAATAVGHFSPRASNSLTTVTTLEQRSVTPTAKARD